MKGICLWKGDKFGVCLWVYVLEAHDGFAVYSGMNGYMDTCFTRMYVPKGNNGFGVCLRVYVPEVNGGFGVHLSKSQHGTKVYISKRNDGYSNVRLREAFPK